ncbi:hypothetical protein Droror1_Dr00013909 [Drosera rotundifolia]
MRRLDELTLYIREDLASSAPSFVTEEGTYELQCLKTCPGDELRFPQLATQSRVTFAEVKEEISISTLQTRSAIITSKIRAGLALLLTSELIDPMGSHPIPRDDKSSYNSTASSDSDGCRTFMIFNVGNAIHISDLNPDNKWPRKSVHFCSSYPTCHAFDGEATDGHDLVIGMSNGDAYSVSLREQLQSAGKKLVGARCYKNNGSFILRCKRKVAEIFFFACRLPFLQKYLFSFSKAGGCTSIAWVPNSNGDFAVTHDDGNLYVYSKNRHGIGDPSFPIIEDKTEFAFARALNTEANPTARWHICEKPINSVAFSNDGAYMSTVGRDGYLRVFGYRNGQLIRFSKSFCSALLCCAWSVDRKYIVTGGADDKVYVWSMEKQRMVAWGKGHKSFVVGVAFDPYWPIPSFDDANQDVMYQFGSVGLDAHLNLWNFRKDVMDPAGERNPSDGSQGQGSSSSYRSPMALPGPIQQPSRRLQDIMELHQPVACHAHAAPLSGLIFTQESVLTSCRMGLVKIWTRPGAPAEGELSNQVSSASSPSLKHWLGIDP